MSSLAINNDCPICRSEDDLPKKQCSNGHAFHINCLSQWAVQTAQLQNIDAVACLLCQEPIPIEINSKIEHLKVRISQAIEKGTSLIERAKAKDSMITNFYLKTLLIDLKPLLDLQSSSDEHLLKLLNDNPLLFDNRVSEYETSLNELTPIIENPQKSVVQPLLFLMLLMITGMCIEALASKCF